MNINKITPWKFILGTLVVLSIPTVFVFSLERYTTSAEHFCLTCHYKMWGQDFLVHSEIHPDSVRCPQCHANPKEIIPKNFSADPERVNPNCVRCHGDMFKKIDTHGFKYNIMDINIPHKLHLQDVGALCTDCHMNVKHDKFHPITNRPRMESCFDCHDNETTPCSKCHQRGAAEVLASLPRTNTIHRKECEKCHEGFAGIPIPFYGSNYPHEKHLSQGISCSECHSNSQMHGQIIKSREECMQCHHQSTEKACIECHTFENDFRQGVALKEVSGDPDVMAEMVTCDVCHSNISAGHSKDAVLQSCAMCHEDAETIQQVEFIQTRTEVSVRRIEDLFIDTKRFVENQPAADLKEIRPLLAVSEKIVETLKSDRSHGFHNAPYTDLLLQRAEEALGKIVNYEEPAQAE